MPGWGTAPEVDPRVVVEQLTAELAAARHAIRELYGCVAHGKDGCGPHDLQPGTLQPYPVEAYIVDRDAQAAAMRAVEEVL